jgi:hypothetical protein
MVKSGSLLLFSVYLTSSQDVYKDFWKNVVESGSDKLYGNTLELDADENYVTYVTTVRTSSNTRRVITSTTICSARCPTQNTKATAVT